MVGIIQEQHPARAELFMQWKGMDWPILVDSQNLLDVAVVPITLLIDEHGIIRGHARGRQDPRELLEAFLAEEFEAPEESAETKKSQEPDLTGLKKQAARLGAAGWRTYAEALTDWGGAERLDEAIAAFTRALELDPEDRRAEFRLGVAYRKRYDSGRGSAADFGAAVDHWSRALALDPNQYIWRRRIQQYGPRLIKPYPFYDWVATARAEISARGETPTALPVEPRGAEIAQPSRSFEARPDPTGGPDAGGKIHRDPGKLIQIQATAVPPQLTPGGASRVHLEFRPNQANDAHWNNEMKGLVVWLDPPPGWQVDRRQIELSNPPQPVSEEARRVEFEVASPAEATAAAKLAAYALYYVCEGVSGQCLYRRQDIELTLPVSGGAGGR